MLAAVTKVGEMFGGSLGQIILSLKAHILTVEVKDPAFRRWNKLVLDRLNSCWKSVINDLCAVRQQELAVLRDVWSPLLRAGTGSR